MSLQKTKGLSTPGPSGAPAKAMSSRLLTMKFMQRATASTLSSNLKENPSFKTSATIASATGMATTADLPHSPSTKLKSSSSPSSSAKRQARLDNLVVQAAFAAEEKARQEAIRRRAEETGDSMWELAVMPSVKVPVGRKGTLGRVKMVGYAEVVAGVVEEEEGEEGEGGEGEENGEVRKRKENEEKWDGEGEGKVGEGEADSSSSEEGYDDNSSSSLSSDSSTNSQDTPAPPFTHSSGRLTFGNFTRHVPATITTTTPGVLADSEADLQSQRTPTSSSNPLHALTSLSIAGSRHPRTQPNANKECYKCAQIGHIAAECRGKKRPRHTDEHYMEDNLLHTGDGAGTRGGRDVKRPRGGDLDSRPPPGAGVGGGVVRKVKRGGRRGRGISSGGRR